MNRPKGFVRIYNGKDEVGSKTDWIARIYDENDKVITARYVENRTEKEARNEVEADITRLHPGKDWTLHPAEETYGGSVKVEIVGEVWIEAHAGAAHDVLWRDVRHAVQWGWDAVILGKAIEEAVYDHLAERGVTDTEVQVFEEFLDTQGLEMVSVTIDVK